jgi:hypothetical protein
MVAQASASQSRAIIGAIVLALVVVGAVLSSRPAGAQVDVHAFLPADTFRHRFQDFGNDGLRLGDRLTGRGRCWMRHDRARSASRIRTAS